MIIARERSEVVVRWSGGGWKHYVGSHFSPPGFAALSFTSACFSGCYNDGWAHLLRLQHCMFCICSSGWNQPVHSIYSSSSFSRPENHLQFIYHSHRVVGVLLYTYPLPTCLRLHYSFLSQVCGGWRIKNSGRCRSAFIHNETMDRWWCRRRWCCCDSRITESLKISAL